MKKISSIKQLDAEKKKIVQHRKALEEKISDNWNDLRVNMKPANLAKDAFRKAISERTGDLFNHKTVVKGLVSFGAAVLVKRMLQKRGSSLFKRK